MLDLDQGVEAGLGTAARTTSSTSSTRNSLRSAHFRADNILIVTPLFLSMEASNPIPHCQLAHC